jgi:hypothetical protein
MTTAVTSSFTAVISNFTAVISCAVDYIYA